MRNTIKKMSYHQTPLPFKRVDTKELISRVARSSGHDSGTVGSITHHIFEEITKALEQCCPVTVRDFGTFHIKPTKPTRLFKFLPSQQLRAILGWSSNYKKKKCVSVSIVT